MSNSSGWDRGATRRARLASWPLDVVIEASISQGLPSASRFITTLIREADHGA